MTRHAVELSRLAIAMLCAAGLAACSKPKHSADLPDLRDRGNVALRAEQKTLALFSRGTTGVIDPAQEGKIAGFAAGYRAEGRGPMTVSVPGDPERKRFAHPAGVMAALERHGVSASSVKLVAYRPSAGLEPSIQLSYSAIGVAANCRPSEASRMDPDPGASAVGCAYAAAFARQVADPLDLAEPRRADLSTHRGQARSRIAESLALPNPSMPQTAR